jgi:hypothetical protein
MAEDPGDGMVGLTWSTKPAIGWPALAAVDDSTVQVGPQFFNGQGLQSASIAPNSSVYCLAGQGMSTPIFLARFSSPESLKL